MFYEWFNKAKISRYIGDLFQTTTLQSFLCKDAWNRDINSRNNKLYKLSDLCLSFPLLHERVSVFMLSWPSSKTVLSRNYHILNEILYMCKLRCYNSFAEPMLLFYWRSYCEILTHGEAAGTCGFVRIFVVNIWNTW